MSWSYDVTQLQSAATGQYTGSSVGLRNQIRLLIQDTQTGRPLLQDEEIDWFQTQEANAYMAAAACCDSLVARGGSVKTKKVGDLMLEYDIGFYRGLGVRLRARGLTYQMPYAGGISVSDKQAQEVNDDAVTPFFFRDFADSSAASQPAPGETQRNALTNPNGL